MKKINLDICRKCIEKRHGKIDYLCVYETNLNVMIQACFVEKNSFGSGAITKTGCLLECRYKLEHLLTGESVEKLHGVKKAFK